jgi:hypothetical protein
MPQKAIVASIKDRKYDLFDRSVTAMKGVTSGL